MLNRADAEALLRVIDGRDRLFIHAERAADILAIIRLLREFPDSQLRLPAEFWLAEVAYRRGDFTYAQQRFDALSPRITDHNESWTAIVPLRTAQLLAQQKHWTKARTLAEECRSYTAASLRPIKPPTRLLPSTRPAPTLLDELLETEAVALL